MDNDADLYDNGQEISTNDGILLRKGPANFVSEIANSTSGTLALIHHLSNEYSIEWTPNDHYLIADADTQEQDDWSFVDTITKRNRTTSECFSGMTPAPTTTASSNLVAAARDGERQLQGSPLQTEPKILRAHLKELKHIDVLRNGHVIKFVNKFDHKVHSEYLFVNGNADGFVRTLQTTHCLQRSRSNKNQYEVVDSVEYDKEKLQKTFAELRIEDIKGKGGWISNMVRHPLEHTMDFFAKMSDVYTILPSPSTPMSSPKTEQHPHNANVSIGSGASNNDDYEVLSTSPRPHSNCQSPNELQCTPKKLAERPMTMRGSPLTTKQWKEFITEDGRVSDIERVKAIIFHGGIEPSLRNEVWKYLLGYFDCNSTAEQCVQLRARKSQEYFQMKLQWLSMSKTQEKHFSDYRERKCQIEKDVKRTDRSQDYFAGDNNPHLSVLQDILMTYVMYNFDLGYVQGMSDLLAPILAIMDHEADAFWCFVGFMDEVFTNFDMDQAGMKRQLQDLNNLIALANPQLYDHLKEHDSGNMYFCFRWLLVWFKREFNHTDILELWEVLWTGLPCTNFHLFISVAILDDQMPIFIDNAFGFTEILKHVNELALTMDVKAVLSKAEAIYLQIKDAEHLTDNVRIIMGHEPLNKNDKSSEEDYDDNFDEIITVDGPDEAQIQRKIDEACERSMYNSFY